MRADKACLKHDVPWQFHKDVSAIQEQELVHALMLNNSNSVGDGAF